MKRGVKGLGLLQQPIDQFLRAANGQRGNVINRLVGIQLGALTAGLRQGIDDVSADPEKPEFEDLEQSDGAGADDDRFDVLFRHVESRFRESISQIGADCNVIGAWQWIAGYGTDRLRIPVASIPVPKQPDSILTVLMYETGSCEIARLPRERIRQARLLASAAPRQRNCCAA